MNTACLKRPVVALGIAANVICFGFYAFGGAAEAPAPAADDETVLRAAPNIAAPRIFSTYSAQADQTDVYPAVDLALIDGPERRLLLSPIYAAPGRGGDGPSVVHLRFYSFSRVALYAAGSALRLTSDGREFWSSRDVLYSFNLDANGGVVEHLGGAVPFDRLAAAVRGDDVRLTVGREEIMLSWGQLQALRGMARCGTSGCWGEGGAGGADVEAR